jgi:glycosyltransferase involved in cell wall biosynthesis
MRKEQRPTLSFIVPAFNEERHIGTTLDRIKHLVDSKFPCELIVVDNGSDDSTAEIAAKRGATVLVHTGCTIGALRNVGARHATGDFLVFLDADVHVTPRWIDHLPKRLAELSERPRMLMGSITGVPANASWIERSWFDPSQRNHRITHIGSGHLITTRAFFEELGGFDEGRRTGEDYDLSARALAGGGEIVDAPDLYVEHLGYPSTIGKFIKREIWHGQGDFDSVRSVVKSKVAILTLSFVAGHVILVAALLGREWRLATGCVAFLALLCMASSYIKYRRRPLIVLASNTGMYYFYFAGRSAALFKALIGRASQRVASSSARSATRRPVPRD